MNNHNTLANAVLGGLAAIGRNCCAEEGRTEVKAESPKIRVTGGSAVRVDPFSTFGEALELAGRFGLLVQADAAGTAMKLTTATGNLVASIQAGTDTAEEFAEEVADVVQ